MTRSPSRNRLELAELDLRLAEATRLHIAKILKARYQISQCEITSLVEGTVVSVHRSIGEDVRGMEGVIDVTTVLPTAASAGSK
jgi:hypothetical protein